MPCALGARSESRPRETTDRSIYLAASTVSILAMTWSGRRVGLREALGAIGSNRILRYNAIFLTGSLAAGGLGYVFHFLTGRLLGPAQYAVVASAVAALYILNLPALIVQTVSARFTSVAAGQDRLGNVPRVLLQVSGLGLTVGLMVSAGLLIFRAPLAAYLQVADQRVIGILAAASLIAILVSATRGALQGLRRFVALSVNTSLDMGTRVLSAAGLVLMGLGTLGGVLALAIGPAVAYASSLFLISGLRDAKTGLRPAFREVGGYAAMTTVAAVGTTYLYNADVLLSKHYLVPEAAGIYAAASILGRVVYFLGLTVAQVMFPEVATLHARDQPHYHVVDLSLGLVGVVAVGLVVTYAVVPSLVLLPFGPAFSPVRPYLWPFAIALGMLTVANLFINYFLSIGSARFAIPLVTVCILETALITSFHSSPGQILWMVVLSMTTLAGALAGMYLVERLANAARISDRIQVPIEDDRAADKA
jgi:O-antigen/teichoic acid export membrane protein